MHVDVDAELARIELRYCGSDTCSFRSAFLQLQDGGFELLISDLLSKTRQWEQIALYTTFFNRVLRR